MSQQQTLVVNSSFLFTLIATTLVLPVGSVLAQEWTLEEDQRVEQPPTYSPFVDQHFPQQVFFGNG